MQARTPGGRCGNGKFERNIRVDNVEIAGAKRIFPASGPPGKPTVGVTFSNVAAACGEAGFVEHARGRTMRNVRVTTAKGEPVRMTNVVNVESPGAVRK